MAQKILTRYSQTRNLEQQQTPSVLAGQRINDNLRPYSFFDWLQRNIGIVPGEEQKQYNLYLLQWYKDRDTEKTVNASRIRNDYVALLKQLSLTFQTETEKNG